jgi:transposase InsO family protein
MAIEDWTRLRIPRIDLKQDQKTAIKFADYALAPPALPGLEGPDRRRGGVPVIFLLASDWPGDQPRRHPTRHPSLNEKVGRSHRIDSEEFYRLLDRIMIDDAGLFNDKLQEWENHHNYQRPHGTLGGPNPYERLKWRTHA